MSAGAGHFLGIVQSNEAGDVVLRARGPAVAGWDERDCELWRAPEATVHAANGYVHGSLDGLLDALGAADPCDVHESERRMRRYVISASRYWSKSDLETDAHVRSRARLAEILSARLVPSGGRGSVRELASAAPRIQFVASRRIPVPFELLPLAPPAHASAPLHQLCRNLPGFAAVMEHTLHTSQEAVEAEGPTPRALLAATAPYESRGRAFLRSEHAPLWDRMRDTLRADTAPLLVDSAPTKGVLDTQELITRYLLDGRRDDGDKAVSDIHVYAHGLTGTSFEDRFKIEFRYDKRLLRGWRALDVLAADFDDALYGVEEEDVVRRPLLWLNCCWAGGQVGEELFAISVELASLGCCVIAPRTEVTAGFAIAFAGRFYAHVAAGAPPGEAFLAARWESIAVSNSPLGLLYAAYGRVD